jgi:anti-sigma regulatory factor (Ser/Thr protein kinase)
MGLGADLGQPSLHELRLLVTELVANSVCHADAKRIDLEARVEDGGIRVKVTDEGPGFDPRDHDLSVSRESGWGLFLVERLAERWGVRRDDGRTSVWFELRPG